MDGRVIQGLRTLNIVLMAAIALVLLLLARQCFFEKEDVLDKLRSTLSDEDLKNLLAGGLAARYTRRRRGATALLTILNDAAPRGCRSLGIGPGPV